jgi:hypothetical protein
MDKSLSGLRYYGIILNILSMKKSTLFKFIVSFITLALFAVVFISVSTVYAVTAYQLKMTLMVNGQPKPKTLHYPSLQQCEGVRTMMLNPVDPKTSLFRDIGTCTKVDVPDTTPIATPVETYVIDQCTAPGCSSTTQIGQVFQSLAECQAKLAQIGSGRCIDTISYNAARDVESTKTNNNYYQPLAPLPGQGETIPRTSTEYLKYFTNLIRILIGLAGALTVLAIVIGGFQYMSTDAVFGKEEGIRKMKRALWGLLLIIGSALILQTINPDLLNLGRLFQTAQQVGTESGNTKPIAFNPGTPSSGNIPVPPGGHYNPGQPTENPNPGTPPVTPPSGTPPIPTPPPYVPPGGTPVPPGGTPPGGGTPPNIPPTPVGGWTDFPTSGSNVVKVACGQKVSDVMASGKTILLQRGCTSYSGFEIKSDVTVAYYGTGARPRVNGGIVFNSGAKNIKIIGLHLHGNDDGSGIDMEGINGAKNILVEDNLIENFDDGINIVAYPSAPAVDGMVVRRNVIVDNTEGTRPQGMYSSKARNILIEENVFDGNGTRCNCTKSTFDHNLYIQQDNEGIVVRGNVIARGSSHGLQLRSGGIAENNLFLENPINMFIDQQGRVADNVVLGSNTFNGFGGAKIGNVGIEVLRIRAHNVTAENNIVAHSNVDSVSENAFMFGGISNGCGGEIPESCEPKPLSSLSNVAFKNNIVDDWRGTAFAKNPNKPTPGYVETGNSWQGAPKSSPRTISTYISSLGGSGGLSTFLSEARKQSKDTWKPQYTANAVNEYIRAGYGR